MQAEPISSDRIRQGPAGFRLADLLALVAGAATALAMPWVNQPEYIRMRGGWLSLNARPMSLDFALEVLGKVSLALVPVALLQAARRGTRVGPASFLLACLGLPWLTQGLHDRLLLAWLARRHGPPMVVGIPAGEARRWEEMTRWPFYIGGVAVALLALAALVSWRRRLPGWLQSALLMTAWTGLLGAVTGNTWIRVAVSLVDRLPIVHPVLISPLDVFLIKWPSFLLYGLPAAATLLGRRTPRDSAWSLLDRMAVALATISGLLAVARISVDLYRHGRPIPGTAEVLALVAAGVSAALMVRYLGPA